MSMGLIGRKRGMGQIFDENGAVTSVTFVEILPNRVVYVKTKERDAYQAIQLTTGTVPLFRLSKSEAGHFTKAKVEPGRGLKEFRFSAQDEENFKDLIQGKEIRLDDLFSTGQWVDVSALSKGKGFSGVIKRHHFSSQDATHGNSLSHRAPGSIGQRQSPGRVFKGKKMAGQLGNCYRTIQSLKVIEVRPEQCLLLVKGSIPGAIGARVFVRSAVKKKTKSNL